MAVDGGRQEILLPGTHARVSPTFSCRPLDALSEPSIECANLKLVTVTTGFERVLYLNGAVFALSAGRYAINSARCVVGPLIDVRQENLKFTRHPVMLDGGVTLECEGLLTYQIVDVYKLVKNMGADDVERALQDVTKAELVSFRIC